MLKRILPYMKRYRKYAFIAPIAVICEVLIDITIPRMMARIVDVGIANKDVNMVFTVSGWMILMALVALLFGVTASRCASVASMGFGCELREAVFHKVQDMSFKNIDRFSVASLLTRLTTDISNAERAAMISMRMLVRSPVMLISAIFMASRINGTLARVFMIALPILITSLIVISKMARPRFLAMLGRYDKMNASVQENLMGIRVVKSFVRAKSEKEKFQGSNEALYQAAVRAQKVVVWNWPIMNITMYCCIVAVLWFGGVQIIDGRMLTGDLLSFISYISQIMMSLMMMGMAMLMLTMSSASIARITEILSEEVDITDDHADPSIQALDGSIEFRNVSFRYNNKSDKNILENVSLKIESGETVGIIGATGSAKTTLVQLIPRLYDVNGGEVLVGGHDVRAYTLKNLRREVSMVLQNNVLFSGTIESNLRWGKKDATSEEIRAVCQAAQADEFVMSFPEGYQSVLGQGGVNISGGQKQRLCIARALLASPKILILDDSTSAVDTATDAKIRKAFAENHHHVTTIIIAQRVASVMDADRILVMDEGQIVATGTHDELLQTSEIYRDVYTSQQKGVA